MFFQGYGVQRDYKEALKWFKLAAAKGSVCSQFYIGIMYQDALGVTKDTNEAKKWYKLAAEQGFEPAKDALKSIGD